MLVLITSSKLCSCDVSIASGVGLFYLTVCRFEMHIDFCAFVC